jgi:hypothetical protein
VNAINAQLKFKYGATIGLNVSSAILPELKLNTDLNSILHGDDVVQGDPQLADYVALYKAGLFLRLDGNIGSAKLNLDYTVTNIHEDIDTAIFSVNALDINLSYFDINFTYNLNLFKSFYISAGYIPSILLSHEGNLDIESFDQRALAGFGFKFGNGATIDLDAIVGISEIIQGSYIHNVMIPVTLSIPFN